MDLGNLNPNQSCKRLRSNVISAVAPSKSSRIVPFESDNDGKAKTQKLFESIFKKQLNPQISFLTLCNQKTALLKLSSSLGSNYQWDHYLGEKERKQDGAEDFGFWYGNKMTFQNCPELGKGPGHSHQPVAVDRLSPQVVYNHQRVTLFNHGHSQQLENRSFGLEGTARSNRCLIHFPTRAENVSLILS